MEGEKDPGEENDKWSHTLVDSTTKGTLVVTGGVGISGALNKGGAAAGITGKNVCKIFRRVCSRKLFQEARRANTCIKYPIHSLHEIPWTKVGNHVLGVTEIPKGNRWT